MTPRNPGEPDAIEQRQDRAETDAADADANRTAQFEAQAETNAQAGRDDANRTVEFATQAGLNAKQSVINESAIEALRQVGAAAKRVTDLLEASAVRARRWTMILAGVVLVIAVLSGAGYWQLRQVTRDGAASRRKIAAQAKANCANQAERDKRYRAELTFLVGYAVGSNNKNPVLRKFKADYPVHLARTIPTVKCP